MGLHFSPVNQHWNYFVALERDFETLARYIEPSDANADSYSLELARILMTATQEVDVLMKLFCKVLDPASDPGHLTAYESVIADKLPEFKQQTVRITRFGIESKPFVSWTNGLAPFWWTANNKIKHERNVHFEKATLKNTYNSLSALFLTNAYLVKHTLPPNPELTNDWWRVTTRFNPTPCLFHLDGERCMQVGSIDYGTYANEPP